LLCAAFFNIFVEIQTVKIMQTPNRLSQSFAGIFVAALAVLLFTGCQSTTPTTTVSAPAAPAAVAVPTPAPAVAPVNAPPTVAASPQLSSSGAIRIDAGSANAYTNSEGNVWLPDQGFADGDTAERDNTTQIANTKDAALYLTEHYGMSEFSYKVPNGKYTVKLHFAETYEGITGPGQRVFSFNVEGQEFKDFDVFVKAGGALRAYVETVNVEVTDGKLDIKFTPNVENPEINGIEILPAS
jgi:hypothetical protein